MGVYLDIWVQIITSN